MKEIMLDFTYVLRENLLKKLDAKGKLKLEISMFQRISMNVYKVRV